MEMGGGGGEMVAVPGEGGGGGGGFGGRGGGEGALVMGECWSVRSGGGVVGGTSMETVEREASGGVGVPRGVVVPGEVGGGLDMPGGVLGGIVVPGGLGAEPTTRIVCHFCRRQFCYQSDLKRHIATHTGEKPYVCPYCPYRSAQKGNVAKHARMKHDPTTTSQQVLVLGEGGGGRGGGRE